MRGNSGALDYCFKTPLSKARTRYKNRIPLRHGLARQVGLTREHRRVWCTVIKCAVESPLGAWRLQPLRQPPDDALLVDARHNAMPRGQKVHASKDLVFVFDPCTASLEHRRP